MRILINPESRIRIPDQILALAEFALRYDSVYLTCSKKLSLPQTENSKRRGDAYLNERSVIFKEEMVGVLSEYSCLMCVQFLGSGSRAGLQWRCSASSVF